MRGAAKMRWGRPKDSLGFAAGRTAERPECRTKGVYVFAVKLKETEKLVKQSLVTNTGSLRLTSVLSSLLQGDKQQESRGMAGACGGRAGQGGAPAQAAGHSAVKDTFIGLQLIQAQGSVSGSTGIPRRGRSVRRTREPRRRACASCWPSSARRRTPRSARHFRRQGADFCLCERLRELLAVQHLEAHDTFRAPV